MNEFNPGGDSPQNSNARGQALLEYALILALVAVAFGFAIAATGPAIGNVFCNVVDNIVPDEEGYENCGTGETVYLSTSIAGMGGQAIQFWQTVTWVAQNPQLETPFPTALPRPATLRPTAFQSLTPSPSWTPSPTPSPTFTPSPSATFTPGPSPTPSDRSFRVPYADRIFDRENWRLDNGAALDGPHWTGAFYPTTNFSGTPFPADRVLVDLSLASGAAPLTLAEGWNQSITDFSVVFTRTITLMDAQPLHFNFTIGNADQVTIIVDGATVITRNTPGSQTASTGNLAAGPHTIEIRFADSGGDASLSMRFTRNVNPSDTTQSCNWNVLERADDSASESRMLKENGTDDFAAPNNWPANQTCVLELRGYVDTSGATNPQLSFWDIWDFATVSSAVAQIQIGNYVTRNGQFDRSQANWQTFDLRQAGTANYNWTRTQINLAGLGLSNQITFRFVLGSTSGGRVRWLLDDLQVLEAPAADELRTVGDNWNLNTRTQLDEFIFNSDTNWTLERFPSPFVPRGSVWRWDITSNRARASSTSLELAPTTDILRQNLNPAATTPRAHYVEFKYPFDFRPSAGAPTADDDGDTGAPLLTFWYAYELQPGSSLQVQYARPVDRGVTGVPADPANPGGWVTIPSDGLLVNFTPPAGAPGRNEQIARTNLNFRSVSIRMNTIPNWDTEPFRIRLAVFVNSGITAGTGVWFDDIEIERDTQALYLLYPFIDSAEDEAFTTGNWTSTGAWGRSANDRGGAMNSATAYADSPNLPASPGTDTTFELRKTIDLLLDTPENIPGVGEAPGSRAPASRPFLTFWHQRDTDTGGVFAVDLWTPLRNAWTPIWTYNHADATSEQRAWERVEIDLRAALMVSLRAAPAVSGIGNWYWGEPSDTNGANIRGNNSGAGAVLTDDDIRIRFRFVTGGSAGDGIFVDEIRIQEQQEWAHRLWPISQSGAGGPGHARFRDCIDDLCTETSSAFPNGPWYERWHRNQSDWEAVYDRRTRNQTQETLVLHESPTTNYRPYTFVVSEFRPVIDLRSTDASTMPQLTFWTRYNIANGALVRVDIATELPFVGTGVTPGSEPANSLSINYDKMAGWSAWTEGVWRQNQTNRNATQNSAWTWNAIDLRPYAANGATPGRRIRVRFVLDNFNSPNDGQGFYVDELYFTYNNTPLRPPLNDTGTSIANWITEGDWGLTQDRNAPVADEGVADLGSTSWLGILYDCETLTRPGTTTPYDCATAGNAAPTSTFDTILNDWEPQFQAHLSAEPGSLPSAIQQALITPVISERYGTTGTPQTVSGRAPAIFTDKWTARWTRAVRLEPGTYVVAVNSDDGIRLRIDNRTGTSIGSNRYIVNDWNGRGFGTLTRASFDVTGTASINRVLELRYFENTGDAGLSVSITRNSYSFSDTPNPFDGTNFNQRTSLTNSSYSLILDRNLNLQGFSAATMTYQRLYDLENSGATFRVEISTDGGLTWTPDPADADGQETLTANAVRENDLWEQRTVRLPAGEQFVRVRFRLATTSNTGSTNGVWLDDIRFQAG